MSRRHTDREFEAELAELRQRILLMAGRVEKMIALAMQALVEEDLELARTTIRRDDRVNQDEIEIDERCLLILARWQPMAFDLRFITHASKMGTDLERIGDMAVHICERVEDLYQSGYGGPFVRIPRMAEIVQEMLHDAVDAFVAEDVEQAEAVLRRDDEVDALYHDIFLGLLQRMSAGIEPVARCVAVQNIATYLERIGDHATNLAEQVIFVLRGRDVRHGGKRSPSDPPPVNSV
ncbi:MAG: phosphate signaling complex protein PhoU [Deltaproteobacteria bacterium]|nr:phosphate signaling complex protein PhoU [Deltaproteobacteria bacterium]